MDNRLAELRREKGFKQKDVAKALGVKPNTVSGWEHGARQMDHQTLNRLADYFGVSIDYLLNREEKSPETEKAPDAAEAAPGAGGTISVDEARILLARLGFLKEGRDLTEKDLALLSHVVGILDAHFGQ